MNTYNSYSSNINKTNITTNSILPVMSPITFFNGGGGGAFNFSSTGRINFSPTETFFPGTTLYYVFTYSALITNIYSTAGGVTTVNNNVGTLNTAAGANRFTIKKSNVDVLIVGGGGSGGNNSGGGGGAGQVKYLNNVELSGNFFACVGPGGAQSNNTISIRNNGYFSFITPENTPNFGGILNPFLTNLSIMAYGGAYGGGTNNIIPFNAGGIETQMYIGSYGGGTGVRSGSTPYGGGDVYNNKYDLSGVSLNGEAVLNGYAGGYANRGWPIIGSNLATSGSGGGGGAGQGGYPTGTHLSNTLSSTNNGNGGKGGNGIGGQNTIYHTILSDISNSNLMPNSSVWVNSLKDPSGYLYIGGGGGGGCYENYMFPGTYFTAGGLGGGGNGGGGNYGTNSGTSNTGGGGGGGGFRANLTGYGNYQGRAGGSGLVVIRVQL